MKPASVRSTILLAGLLGLLVSLFAVAEFYQASLRSVCSINAFFSCATVDQSGKTTTLGVPDYLWGVGGFLLILIVTGVAEKRPKDRAPVYLLALLTTVGVALSAYLAYVELAEIHALCIVCAIAYMFGVVAWAGALWLLANRRVPEAAPPHPEGPTQGPEAS